MIKLFLTDIDGCLSEPYRAFDLDQFMTLRDWGRMAEGDERIPRLGICSGRSYAYVEAVAQALDLRGPALFESGGGRFDLPLARIRWSSALTDEVEAQLDDVRAFFLRDVLPLGGFSLDYGKRAQAGVVTLETQKLVRAIEMTRRFVNNGHPDLVVADTHVSIDVLPRRLTKQIAIEEAAEEDGLRLAEVAFIGDTRGDIGGLEVVGHSFAPRNAQSIVQDVVDVVTEGEALDGVIEAFEHCVRFNENILLSAEAS